MAPVLTKRQQEFIDRIRSDGCLMRTPEGFQFVDTETAHQRVVKNLILKGYLVDNDDSFLGAESQTLRAADDL